MEDRDDISRGMSPNFGDAARKGPIDEAMAPDRHREYRDTESAMDGGQDTSPSREEEDAFAVVVM